MFYDRPIKLKNAFRFLSVGTGFVNLNHDELVVKLIIYTFAPF